MPAWLGTDRLPTRLGGVRASVFDLKWGVNQFDTAINPKNRWNRSADSSQNSYLVGQVKGFQLDREYAPVYHGNLVLR